MSDFVTKDEFKELKLDVKNINAKVGVLNDSVIRIGCSIDDMPNKVIAQLVETVYNNCPRGKTIDNLESSRQWITKIIIGIVITSIMGLVITQV